jgi:hypothetical protein
MSTISIHKGLLIGINRKDLIPEFYRSAERPDSTRVNVDDIETRLSKKEIEALKDLACKAYNKSRSKTAAETDKWPNITKTYTDLLKISKLVQDDKGRIVSDLKTLEIALKSWVEESPQRWLFLKMKDGTLVPYLCSSIAYVPASGYRGDSAKVDLALAYEKSDGTRSLRTFTFYKSDFSREYEIEGEEKPKRRGSQGVPVATLCNYKNLYLGTKELYDEYVEQVKKFDKVRGSTGVVMVANNESMGLYSSSWSPNTLDKWMKTGKDDTLSIFITDENEEEKTTEGGYYSYFSGDSKSELAQNSSFWGTFPISFPFHPRLKCFDMSLQRHCLIHINFLEVKKFDKALGEKLVIPEKDRVYIDMLMAAASFKTEDIVAGKSGGTAIIATGPPGTGKTLTAEIYSEKVGRPLYSAQGRALERDPPIGRGRRLHPCAPRRYFSERCCRRVPSRSGVLFRNTLHEHQQEGRGGRRRHPKQVCSHPEIQPLHRRSLEKRLGGSQRAVRGSAVESRHQGTDDMEERAVWTLDQNAPEKHQEVFSCHEAEAQRGDGKNGERVLACN